MTQSQSLIVLAQQILEAAKGLEQDPCPSTTPEKRLAFRKSIISNTYALQNLVIGGPELLERQQIAYQTSSCLAWLVRFDIFTHIPVPAAFSDDYASGESLEKSILYRELADRANVPLTRLQSVARMAMTSGLFRDVEQGSGIAHTALSAQFAADKSLRDWTAFMCRYSSPMAAQMSEATAQWGDTAAKDRTAHNIAFATQLPWFDYVKTTPGLPEVFAAYMRAMGRSEGGNLKHLVNGFDWQSLGKDAVIVDVGGSTGQASIALAEAFPNLRFVVQDIPEVVATGPRILAELASERQDENWMSLASRVTFAAHNFFDPQPQLESHTTTAVYLLRKVLHDWPFSLAHDILQRLATVIHDNPERSARIIIMDTVLPSPGSLDPYNEACLRVRDLTMLQCFNSKERELSEWEALLDSTEPKLEIMSVNCPLGSSMAIIEANIATQLQ